MTNRSKQKGTTAETDVVKYLQSRGHAHARRNPPAGKNDIGDVDCYEDVVLEVKDCKAMTLPAWLKELEAEKKNAGADIGCVVHKRRGKGSPGEWYATMPFADFCDIIEANEAMVAEFIKKKGKA
jgi:hypothetical protein